jgi:hypothetical protein
MDDELQTGTRRIRVEWVSAAALGITLACIFAGQAVERYAEQTAPPAAVETARVKPHFNSIDYAATASIKSGVVVIGPCDTRKP